MDEKKEDKQPEKAVEDKDNGDQPKATQLVDDTNLAAKRLEEATKAAREERLAAEESYAKMKLSGRAEAGVKPEPETEDEKWAKDAKKRYEGTGMDPTPDDGAK